MARRLFSGLLLVLFAIAGCGQSAAKTQTIVIWHWMTDRDKAFQALAQEYEQQTGIKVKFELYAPSDVYSQKIVAAAQARILPDIFGILDKKIVVASFIESGFVADLTPGFMANDAQWEKRLFPKALADKRFEEGNVYKIKPGIYGVPIDVTNIQILYNKNLLKKAGVRNPPKTFAEFLDAMKALKRVGVPGLISGWGEMWMVDCFASNYAFNIMGEDKVMKTFRGEVPYTDPDWVKVFDLFKQLRDAGGLAEGIVTMVNKYAEQDFALERAAFAFNGSWAVNVYKEMNPDLDYGVMMPPPISPLFPMKIWGGAGSSFVVNNVSPRKAEAIQFLKWLTDKDQQIFLAAETKNLPANRTATTSTPKELAEFSAAMDNTTQQTAWPLNEDYVVFEAFTKGIQSIIIGELTPQQVAADVQQVKQKQLEKQKRRQ